MMICDLCKSESNYIDDKLGERVCSDCGYVMVSHLFEETVSNVSMENGELIIRSGDRGELGSIMGQTVDSSMNKKLVSRLRRNQSWLQDKSIKNMGKGILECNMILSPWLPNNNLKERTYSYYKTFFKDRHTYRWTVGTRATAIVFLVLKENGISVSLQELAKNNGENPQSVSKAARYFARELKKPWLLHQNSLPNMIEKATVDLLKQSNVFRTKTREREFVSDTRTIAEYVYTQVTERNMHFSKNHLAASFWITCLLRTRGGWPEYTQSEIASSCGCSEIGLRDNMRKLYGILNTNKKELKRMRIEQFIAGVRYG